MSTVARSDSKLKPSTHTTAPLRIVMTAPVKAAPKEALKAIMDVGRVEKYLPSIKQAVVECDAHGKPNARFCTVSGMGKLREDIVWYQEESGYAYAAAPKRSLPMTDHLGVATVNSDGHGGSIVRWEQYFNWKGFFKPMMMKLMFPSMMKSLGKGIQADLGTNGSVETRWV